MADRFCSLTGTATAANGTTWALAFGTFAEAVTGTLAGETCYVKGTTAEAVTITADFNGTVSSPCFFIGVDAATSTEPPNAADVSTSRTDTLPIVTVTGNLDLIWNTGFAYFWGIHFDCPDNFQIGNGATTGNTGYVFEQCILETSDLMMFGDERQDHSCVLKDCEVIGVDTTTRFQLNGGSFFWDGGLLSGIWTTAGFFNRDEIIGGNVTATIRGVDLSVLGADPLAVASVLQADHIRIINCRLGTSFVTTTRASLVGWGSRVDIHASKAGTAVNTEITDTSLESIFGIVSTEATVVRSGGSNDGVAGHSQKMTVDAGTTFERSIGLQSNPIYGRLDATTTQTVTIYVHTVNGGTAGANDRDDDEVWAELYYPGNDTTQYKLVTSKPIPLATVSPLTDDSSTWNSSANDSQKIEFVLSDIDHVGPIYAYVYFANNTGSTSIYVDNALYVT